MVTEAMIDDLKAQEGAAYQKFSEASRRRKDAEIEMAWQKSGLKPGDKVIYRGAEYFATQFEPCGWLLGAKVKKDGTQSRVEACLYRDWAKAE